MACGTPSCHPWGGSISQQPQWWQVLPAAATTLSLSATCQELRSLQHPLHTCPPNEWQQQPGSCCWAQGKCWTWCQGTRHWLQTATARRPHHKAATPTARSHFFLATSSSLSNCCHCLHAQATDAKARLQLQPLLRVEGQPRVYASGDRGPS